jgi:hypothetical protein
MFPGRIAVRAHTSTRQQHSTHGAWYLEELVTQKRIIVRPAAAQAELGS